MPVKLVVNSTSANYPTAIEAERGKITPPNLLKKYKGKNICQLGGELEEL